MENEAYPIFCGKVMKITRQVEMPDIGQCTELHYLPGMDEVTNVDALSSLLPSIPTPEGHVPLEQRMKGVVIPLKVETAIVQGSDVRTCIAEIELADGSKKPCYELEIIHSPGNGGMFSSGMYDGFKYQKVLSDDSI